MGDGGNGSAEGVADGEGFTGGEQAANISASKARLRIVLCILSPHKQSEYLHDERERPGSQLSGRRDSDRPAIY